jgi:CubicO group peptidase (beta-lactamase class C family)
MRNWLQAFAFKCNLYRHVKDGVIVHETYYNGADKDSLNYLASVGKTAVGLVIGAAVRQGKVSLDTPLVDYGVVAPTWKNTPQSSLGTAARGGGGGVGYRGSGGGGRAAYRGSGSGSGGSGGSGGGAFVFPAAELGGGITWGGDEWATVTTRHLLAQVTGWGTAEAGSRFDYDSSGLVLGVLSQLLRAVTGQQPAKWARKHLTEPLVGTP